MVAKTPEEQIKRWTRSLIGPRTRFRSTRQLSVASGLSHNTVGNILDTGRADPESPGKIANAPGRRRVEIFLMGGWLTREELEAVPPELDRLTTLYLSLPENSRAVFLRSWDHLLSILQQGGQPHPHGDSESPQPT